MAYKLKSISLSLKLKPKGHRKRLHNGKKTAIKAPTVGFFAQRKLQKQVNLKYRSVHGYGSVRTNLAIHRTDPTLLQLSSLTWEMLQVQQGKDALKHQPRGSTLQALNKC